MGSYKVQNTSVADVTITLATDGESVTLTPGQEMYITDNDWDALTNTERQDFSIVARRGVTGDSRTLSSTRTFIEAGDATDGPFYMSVYDATATTIHVVGNGSATGSVKLYGTIEGAAADQNWVLLKSFTLSASSSEVYHIGIDKPFYMLKLDLSSVAGSSGVNEVQTVTVDATGGTFTLTYSGQTTGAIAENAAAATVQTALEALSNIAPGDVAVTGSAGGPFTLTFGGTLAYRDIEELTASGASLTGGASTVTVVTTTPGSSDGAVDIYGIKAHGK